MPNLSPSRSGVLKARTQANLIQYLNIDLDLAFTFLETARIVAESNARHSKSAVEKARTALASIRKFQRHVEDQNAAASINDQANRLEVAINAFARV